MESNKKLVSKSLVMQIETITARGSIDNAFLQESLTEAEFETFRQRLLKLLNQVDDAVEGGESEEHLKNLIKPFLSSTNFGEEYYINTKERQDLAIHNGKTRQSNVGVIIEAKRPSNSEMISGDDLNRKAFHEAILYYLRERIDNGNEDIKHVIITDVYRWYIFDAQDFERHFYESKKLTGWYKEWKQGQKVSSRTQFVYDHLSEFVSELDESIKGAEINISKYRKLLEKDQLSRDEQKKLVPAFKLFTPTHLLKKPFASDSNELNKDFYRELLYIMGLKEYKEKGTHYITRLDEGNRQHASLIENTITQLESLNVLSRLPNRTQFGDDEDEQLFNVAIQLLITWMNRILFLKLLEAQLFKYHREDKRFKFLGPRDIVEYDGLNKLFFQVLAVPEDERSDRIQQHYSHIPYLNSSLFDVAEIEQQAIRISELEDNLEMPVHSRSKITEEGQQLKGKSLSALEYLLRFLHSYNFNTEGTAEVQKEAKTLINASVLGRIFEKINGYKDGSFFTPGYITEYMCKETIRRAVLQKFEEVLEYPPAPQIPHSNSLLGGERTGEAGLTPGMSSEEAKTKLPEELLKTARHLRKNQTDAEKLLWQLLRNRQLANAKIRRQHPIAEGIILDFYCHHAKLSIEIDGGYHDTDQQQAADAERTKLLNDRGIRVVRFTNEQVMQETESVLMEIARNLSLEEDKANLPSPGGRRAGDEGERTFADIHNAIGRDVSMEEANEIVNSITICDPAVGSGHFLVSALNELIAIKSELGILCYIDNDGNYRRFRDVAISVDNDELSVSVGADPFFEYRVHSEWKENGTIKRTVGSDTQRLQKALFREKNILIENCLFGVDINPNSVNICRLRLWIELLKHAYYRENNPHSNSLPRGERTKPPSPAGRRAGDEGEKGGKYQQLEVLPNIDINIKQGNSLVSRFGLDADLSQILTNNDDLTIAEYKQAVRSYKETGNREHKRTLKEQIGSIKESFTVGLKELHPVRQKLKKQQGILIKEEAKLDLFEGDKKSKKEQKKIKKAKKKIGKLEEELAELENTSFYDQAFEWRFEFPEVLDEDGNFAGFDAVIGNPPYVRQELLKDIKPYLKDEYEAYSGYADLYQYFVEQGMRLLKSGGLFHYIVSNKWMRTNYGKPLRQWLQQFQIKSIIDFGDLQVFEEATTYPCLFQLQKKDINSSFTASEIENLDFDSIEAVLKRKQFEVEQKMLMHEGWTLVEKDQQYLIRKLEKSNKELGEFIEGEVYRGVLTGLNEAFVIDEETRKKLLKDDSKSNKLIKPYLRGRDINRYEEPKTDNYLIFTRRGVNIDDYPAIKNHLKKFKAQLEPRPKNVASSEWEGRKPGSYKWYEIQDTVEYHKKFDRSKIMYQVFQVAPGFTYDTNGAFSNNSIWIMPNADKSLLGILNSKLGWFFISTYCTEIRNGYQLIYKYLKNIPIASEQSKNKKIESLVDQILTAKEEDPKADTSELEKEIDQLVYELYGLSEEEIGIVESV